MVAMVPLSLSQHALGTIHTYAEFLILLGRTSPRANGYMADIATGSNTRPSTPPFSFPAHSYPRNRQLNA